MRRVPMIMFLLGEAVLFFQLLSWDEAAFAQLLLLSQIPVLFLIKPFLFRGETHFEPAISRKTRVFLFLLVALLIGPFVILAQAEKHLNSVETAGLGMFGEGREALLVLGFALSTIFVMTVLIQRRGVSRWK